MALNFAVTSTCKKSRSSLNGLTLLTSRRKHLSKYILSESNRSYKGFLSEKIDNLVKWYDEFTGMSEVREAQARVLEEERNFRKAQEIRRNVLTELNNLQSKIKEVYAELDSTSRSDDKYINLVTLEHKLLKEEKVIKEKFSDAEKDERNSFATLSNMVKVSHERERAQRERTKYWSLIGSILGTLFGIIGTSLNNHFKINELKELIKKSKVSVDKNIETVNIENLFHSINSKLTKVEDKLKIIESYSSKNITLEQSKPSESNVLTQSECLPINEVEQVTETLKNEFAHTKTLLYILAAISIIVPVITHYSV